MKTIAGSAVLAAALTAALSAPAVAPAHAETIKLDCKGLEVYKIDRGPGAEFAPAAVTREEDYACGLVVSSRTKTSFRVGAGLFAKR